MNLTTEFMADAAAPEVFDAFHQYKISRDPARFFPSKLVKWEFRVLTEYTLGIGAQYDWKIWLLGIPVLAFREQVVAWEEGRRVAYQAISDWQMNFCVDLEPAEFGTRVKVMTDLSLPEFPVINRFLRPLYNWGLEKVCHRGLDREGIKTHRAI